MVCPRLELDPLLNHDATGRHPLSRRECSQSKSNQRRQPPTTTVEAEAEARIHKRDPNHSRLPLDAHTLQRAGIILP